MKNINLNFQITDLENKPIEPTFYASKALAGALMNEKQGDAVKYFDWALKLNRNEEIEVDNSDFETIKEIVKKSDFLYMIVKAQILKALSEAKEKK